MRGVEGRVSGAPAGGGEVVPFAAADLRVKNLEERVGEFRLPAGIERVLKLRLGDSQTLPPFEAGSVFDYQPALFEGYGAGAGFATFAPVVLGLAPCVSRLGRAAKA